MLRRRGRIFRHDDQTFAPSPIQFVLRSRKPRAEIFDLEIQLKTARDKVAHLYARWHELELLQSVPRTTETSSGL